MMSPSPNSPGTPTPPDEFKPRSAKEVTERFGKKIANQWFAAVTGRRNAMMKVLQRLDEESDDAKDARIEYEMDAFDDEMHYREARKIARAKLTAVPERVHEMNFMYEMIGTACKKTEENLTNGPLSPEEHLAIGEKLAKERAKMLVLEALIAKGSCTFKNVEPYMRADPAFAGLTSESLLSCYGYALNFTRRQHWITIS